MEKLEKRQMELMEKLLWGNPTEDEKMEYEELAKEIHRKMVEKLGVDIKMYKED